MQKTWSFMAPVYKQTLEYIHKELIEALAMFTAMEKNPMQIVYVSALDKLQELDSNNNDLRKYRDEACRTSYLDYYRKSIQELSAN